MANLDDHLKALHDYIRHAYCETPIDVSVTMMSGRKMVLLFPVAPVVLPEPAVEEEWQPFVLTAFQKAILKALEGKALRTDALGAVVGDRGRLFKKGGLNELKERGLVENHPRLGFYRTDAPPPELDQTN